MKYSGKIFPLDKFIITSVRKRRKSLGITQEDLSLELGLSSTFVSLVESPIRREKYNIHHLNKIAEIMHCTIADFLPPSFLKDNV